MAKRKGKIYIYKKVSFKPTLQKSNVGNIGHHTVMSNSGIVRLKVKKKDS